MKKANYILALLAVLFLICTSDLSAQTGKIEENDFEIGGKMTTYPKVDWLKGNPVSEFKKDSIYVVDLWATWCRPCIFAMPHFSTLSTKFKGKIDFIAQDVMEDNKEKVVEFVKKDGLNWNFKVAYAGGNKSDFHKNWIVAAGVSSIPQTYIIQNNKMVWQTFPLDLTEEILQLLLDGKFTVEKAEAIVARNKAAN